MTEELAARALRFREVVAAATGSGGVRDALEPLVAADDFLLVGRHKQELDWPAAVAAIDRWAQASDFDSDLRRLEQAGSLVFMELDERSLREGEAVALNTMTVFEFDADGKIRRIDCYQ